MTVHIATNTRNDMVEALIAAIDAGSGAGKLRIYDGSQPADANTAVSTQVLLLEFTLQDPCATVSGDTATFDVTPAITDDALATSTATWGRFLDSDNNAIMDVTVGTDITITDTTLETGQTVTVVSGTIQLAA